MAETAVLLGIYALACAVLLMLSTRAVAAVAGAGRSVALRRPGAPTGLADISVLLLPVIVVAIGPNGSLAASRTMGLPAAIAALVIFRLAPPWARRKVVPIAVLTLGFAGLAVTRSYARGSPSHIHYGLVLAGPGRAGPQLVLLQAYGFMAVGAWLLWLTTDRTSAPAMAILRRKVRREPGWTRARWGLLLIPVVGVSIELLGTANWFGLRWWSAALTGAIVVAALVLPVVSPVVAAEVMLAGLSLLGLYGIGLLFFWPNHIPLPSAYTDQVRFGAVWVASRDGAWLAGVEGAACLVACCWLVTRIFGAQPELTGRVRRLTQTRADAVETAAAELRRVERDLHDGAQARLVALGMSLRAAEQLMANSPDAAVQLVAEARMASVVALQELRDLVRGICPPVLVERGLADAIRALALDTPLHVTVDIDLPARLDAALESACYFAVSEILVNAVKHSGARSVDVRARQSDGVLRICVTDDGAGGADPRNGSGLRGLERRLGAFDGVLAISSPPGGPTIIVVEVPCA